ncbi:hypothetical protein PP182_05785 [Maribacter sp. PR1]|uniref:Dihydroorotase n=1 Tax=Maribacter cobaltidurans TaxID=1178778 RepID=A0ABU7IRR6_9FLAO|nr:MULTISPECIES: hypothetical protein [Maribacter]MDC6388181.1 hypothetical protein [Maribacter sp. PR1]MEE1975569.1 hypothetical protein [Maribacter cobaltidurans]
MKHVLTFLTLFLVSFGVFGQEKSNEIEVGDIFTIQTDSNLPFNHIHFPSSNFIIKRGGIANYKSLDDVKVKVVKVYDNDVIKITSLNGKKFFNIYKYVKADIEEALENGELQYIDLSKKSTVAVN